MQLAGMELGTVARHLNLRAKASNAMLYYTQEVPSKALTLIFPLFMFPSLCCQRILVSMEVLELTKLFLEELQVRDVLRPCHIKPSSQESLQFKVIS